MAKHPSLMTSAERLAASVERTAREDAKVIAAAATLMRICDRIKVSSAPRDFLATLDGPALCNAVYDLTGCDAIYEMGRDIEGEAGYPHDPEAPMFSEADYRSDLAWEAA